MANSSEVSALLPAAVRAAPLLATLLAICSSSGSSQRCTYTTSNFPGGAAVVNNPASCPISTPPGGRNQNYSTSVSTPSGTTTGTGSLTFANANGDVVTDLASVNYTAGLSNTYDSYLFSGRYKAGSVAAANGSDQAYNQIPRSSGGVATATVKLTYKTGSPAAIMGATSLDPGAGGTLTGEYYQSDLVPPVTYQWYQNGAIIDGATSNTVSISGGSVAWQSDDYEFRVTDAQGRSVSAFQSVQTTSGCGSQFLCLRSR